MEDVFVRNDTTHDHMTRHCNDIHALIARNNMQACNVRFAVVKLYNHLSKLLYWNVTFVCFNGNLKKYIVQNDVKFF